MIEVRHITHYFGHPCYRQSSMQVLDDVNLAIGDGTFVSFLGPSGCGKTTLLRIVHGLLKPTAGQVVIDGKVVQGPSADRAMVFQEFNLLPWRSTQRNTELGLEVQSADRSFRARLASDALRLVGLGGFNRHYPHELSGGMKQLVGLARALCTGPKYLLMDEPFGALDLQVRELMQIELMKLWEEDRKTVLFVTHSVEEAIFLSDRIVVFSARPARVLETVDVRLPRPRWQKEEELRGSPAFVEYRQRLWRLLKQELRQSGVSGPPAQGVGGAPLR